MEMEMGCHLEIEDGKGFAQKKKKVGSLRHLLSY